MSVLYEQAGATHFAAVHFLVAATQLQHSVLLVVCSTSLFITQCHSFLVPEAPCQLLRWACQCCPPLLHSSLEPLGSARLLKFKPICRWRSGSIAAIDRPHCNSYCYSQVFAGRYEVNPMYINYMLELLKYDAILVCDDSGSMNSPADPDVGFQSGQSTGPGCAGRGLPHNTSPALPHNTPFLFAQQRAG